MRVVVLPVLFLFIFSGSSPRLIAQAPAAELAHQLSETGAIPVLAAATAKSFAITQRVSVAPPGGDQTKPDLAKGIFLIASRELKDPNFAQTVVLLVEYDTKGAMGLVINRPTNLALSMVLPAMQELEDRTDTVFIGGPVGQDRLVLLIRAEERPNDAEHVFGNIYVSGSRVALEQMLQTVEPQENFHAYVGYAGWAPGQLEGEVARGDWILSSANGETVFDKESSEVWPELIRQNSGFWVKQGLQPSPWQTAAVMCFEHGAGC